MVERTSFSRDVSACVPMSFVCSVLRDWRIHWNSWYSLAGFVPGMSRERFAQRSVNVCVAGWVAQMERWDAVSGTLRCSTEDADSYTRFSSAWNSRLPRDLPRRGTQLAPFSLSLQVIVALFGRGWFFSVFCFVTFLFFKPLLSHKL